MNSFHDYLKNVLSKKTITAAILFLSIAARIIQLVYFFNIRRDNAYQHIAAKNFVAGHGISMPKLIPDDISATVYEPLINWPPGYSFLLSPFYILYNGNYIAAGLTVSIIFAVLLIFISRKILTLLGLPIYLINSFTLISGFFIYFFYHIPSTDAIAIPLAMTGIYYSLLLLQSPGNWVGKMTCMTVSLIACAAIKYLYIPIVFIIPVFVAWKGFSEKQKQLQKAGIVSILLVLIVLSAMLGWQKHVAGSATYINSSGRGFFPDNLLDIHPSIPSAFIKPETATLLLPHKFEPFFNLLFQCIHIAAILIVCFFAGKRIIRHGLKGFNLKDSFFYMSFFVSIAIILLLSTLSLTVEKESFSATRFWTYVEEERYYGLSTILIQLTVFAFYKTCRSHRSKIFRYGFYVLFLLLITEMFRGVMFNVNRISRFGKEEYGWQYEYRFQQYADSIIEKARRKKSFEKIVVSGSSSYMSLRVGLYSDAVVMKDPVTADKLLSLKAKKPTLLLLILSEENVPPFQLLLTSAGVELAGKLNELYFYTVYVNPE